MSGNSWESRVAATADEVAICEVGPRDGLQSVARTMPTAIKLRWITALADAGLREIEVGSFVPSRLLPQMADTGEVVRRAVKIPGLRVVALVPNLHGAEAAVAAGAHCLTVPVSASAAHSQANVRKTPARMVDEVEAICAFRDGLPPDRRPRIEATVATAFGCAVEGAVPEDRAIGLAVAIAGRGADSVGLSDTAGVGNPAQTKRLFTRLRAELGDKAGGAHLHDTLGLALANVVAALDAGVRSFDSSHGGLGGCPYVPEAAGNVPTEDLVFMLAGMGFRTGIDLARLIAAREILLEGLPGEHLVGRVGDSRLPRRLIFGNGGAS